MGIIIIAYIYKPEVNKSIIALMTTLYNYSLILISGFAVIVFILLFFVSAPYGRFLREGWGRTIRSKWAWMIMESPSPLLMVFFFFYSGHMSLVTCVFLALWLGHYIHRTLIYPFTQSGRDKPYPIILVVMAFIFNSLNGTANGYGVFSLGNYENDWILSWQFLTGILVFALGFYINKTADLKFKKLRIGNPGAYVVPKDWLFKYISSPHYLGEIIEWGGWALATWSLPGLAFFSFTIANLFPRAILSHRWYKANFREYPPERKAIIPFIL